MTIFDFNTMTYEKKCDFVSLFGTHLISKKFESNTVHLYQLGSFFVEMWYDRDEKKLSGINAMKSIGTLEMYLDEISLQDLKVYFNQGLN